MQLKITPEFSEKVFSKVAAISTTELDLEDEKVQLKMAEGFVESLEKEAGLSPAMALGVIQYICEQGSNWAIENSSDKVASTEVWGQEYKKAMEAVRKAEMAIVLGELGDKYAGFGEWVKNTGAGALNWAAETFGANKFRDDQARQAGAAAVDGAMGKVWGGIKDYAGKAWNYLKSPEFLTGVAPSLVAGLGGAFATKAIGGKDMPWWGAGLAGAATGAGVYGLQNYTQAGQNFTENMRKQYADWFQNSNPQAAQ